MAVLTACLSTGQNAMPTWVVLPVPGVWSGHTEGWCASGEKELSEEKHIRLRVLWRMKWNHHYVRGGTEGNAFCIAITVKHFLRLSEWRHGKLAPDREELEEADCKRTRRYPSNKDSVCDHAYDKYNMEPFCLGLRVTKKAWQWWFGDRHIPAGCSLPTVASSLGSSLGSSNVPCNPACLYFPKVIRNYKTRNVFWRPFLLIRWKLNTRERFHSHSSH